MKDEDLEKTRSIESLVDFEKTQSRMSRFKKDDDMELPKESSRSKKNKDILEELDEEEKIEEITEEAEEALAEKNIALAESLLKEEKEDKDKEDNEEEKTTVTKKDSKKDPKKKGLSDKQKNIIMIVVGVLVVIVLVVIMILIFRKPKDDNENNNGANTAQGVNNPVEEKPPVIVDNFYYQDGKLHILNNSNNEIGVYECKYSDEKLCYVGINNNRDDFDVDLLLDQNGNEKVQRLNVYNNDYVFINDNASASDNNIVLYSLKENKVINTYSNVKAFNDNYVIVKDKENKYGLIQLGDTVKEVIKCQYQYLGMIEGEKNLVAKNTTGYVIIDKTNKIQSANISAVNTIKNYNDKLIVTYQNKKYSVYDYEGNLIVSDYTYVALADEYMGLVRSKKLYVRDILGNKYNEEGIALNNITYIREYIYEDNKLVETKRSFAIAKKKDSVEVTVFGVNSTDSPQYINYDLIIGKVNNKYQYVNYLNDKLYFYSDLKKENLIGSYACTNKNGIDSEDSKFDKCFVAKDSVYENNELIKEEDKKRDNTIPIINNRYAFIQDGSDIVLVDLTKSDKQILGTYVNVNTYTGNNGDVITTHSGMVNVIAQSKKSNLYGMINLDTNSATSVYGFDYAYMEKLGDYVLAQNDDKSWVLLNGPKSTNVTYNAKVVNYSSDKKHFKLKEGDKYYVADVDGKIAGEVSYKTVMLYDKFYLGINDSNELYLYDYDAKKITSRAVKSCTSCNLDEKYKVEFKDNKYTISVCNGDKYDVSVYDVTKKKFEGDPDPQPVTPEPSNEQED